MFFFIIISPIFLIYIYLGCGNLSIPLYGRNGGVATTEEVELSEFWRSRRSYKQHKAVRRCRKTCCQLLPLGGRQLHGPRPETTKLEVYEIHPQVARTRALVAHPPVPRVLLLFYSFFITLPYNL